VDAASESRSILSALIAGEPVDVARAALAIAREEYPGLDERAYLRRLDELAAAVQRGVPSGASPERRVGRLNGFLFHELGYAGNESDYYDPKNSFLNEVIDRRVGIPITLAILYVEVARRCGLRADGVGFPGHFLCKISLEEGELFVDAFHGGQLLGLDELKRRLLQAEGGQARLDSRVLRAAPPREILVRLLQNLRQIYTRAGDWPRVLSAVDRMLLIVPRDTRLLRERASAYEKLSGAAAAIRDLETVLEEEPDAPDASELRARVVRLRGMQPRWN
jgi:regulator of sirC expression with transglutaminase-like and TPR domain